MLKRPFKSVIARIAIVALALSLVFPFVPAAFAQDVSIDYAENGVAPVQTFYADDQDGDAIEWSLSGDDAEDFTIEGGVLAFNSPPDYEAAADNDTDNEYDVTVGANGQTLAVTVTVTDVDEDGVATLTQLQPQVSVTVTAKLNDPEDATGTRWQWASSADGSSGWTDIEGAFSATYAPVADDVDNYLRATATYDDSFGEDKTAMAISVAAVEERTRANATPEFPDQDIATDGDQSDTTTRTVNEHTAEGSNIGDPVVAGDADNDVLLYTLGGDDDAKFAIDNESGQLLAEADLDFEALAGATDNCTVRNACAVTITATDPSLATDTIAVTITVVDVNEAPVVTGITEIDQPENATDIDTDAVTVGVQALTYAASDIDSDDDTDDLTWSVEGADADAFSISSARVLTFDELPDFESPADADLDNVYEITVVASDDENAGGELDVEVTVTNVEETGTVELTQLQPLTSIGVTATLTDPDGNVTGTTWQWASVTPGSDETCATGTLVFEDITDATSATYTPVAGDADKCLQAIASYTDAIANDTMPNTEPDVASEESKYVVELRPTGNAAPAFPDEDNDDEADPIEREVPENEDVGTRVGGPVVAEESDNDPLLYSLGGADADTFEIERETGQLATAAKLDYETKNSYTVDVTATDPSGASATMSVTITVTDADDLPEILGDASIDYAENGVAPVQTFYAEDQDGDAIEWSLSGVDAENFTIEGTLEGGVLEYGVLAFNSPPDYEAAADNDTDNEYDVTVGANGQTLAVTVTVTDVDEDGVATLTQLQPQVSVTVTAKLNDPEDATGTRWQWASSADGSSGWTDIEGAVSAIYAPVADDVDNYLRATATYDDSFGEDKTAMAISVAAVEERTRANATPEFPDQNIATDGDQSDTTTRTVNEHTAEGGNIGDPVVAGDADNDVLLYSLGGADVAKFDIDNESGQLLAKADLDYEDAKDVGDTANNNTYVVVVTATDPSLAPDTITVTITVVDVNEAPDVTAITNASVTVSVVENSQIAAADATYEGDDPETSGAVNTSVLTWSVEGADADAFLISSTAVLTFDELPDFESPADADLDNVYEITVVASDDDKAAGELDVEVTVTNADEDGSVMLSQLRPQINGAVTATLTDQDGMITGIEWKWEYSDASDGTYAVITGADSATYTPSSTYKDKFLRATVTYKDAIGSTEDTTSKVSNKAVEERPTGNAAPAFPDQDDDGITDPIEREVAENKDAEENVGNPVAADDPDSDVLLYRLGGADADTFEIDRKTGQLTTTGELDYEIKDSYMVDVTATDPSGASATMSVTITVTDENDDPVISLTPPTSPVVPMDGSVILSTDNPAVGEAITATLEDGNEETNVTWLWSNHAPGDEEWADIEGATDTSYTPTNADHGKHVRATASYDDDSGEGQSAMAATANLVNNFPAFDSASATRSVDENTTAGSNIGDPVAATDVNEEDLTYELSGDDAASFEIWPSGQITVAEGASLDYETKTSYSVTVTATDAAGASDSIDVTIAVNDAGLSNAYDSDDSGDINKDEAVQAVQDYFTDTITRGEVLEILQLYFAG